MYVHSLEMHIADSLKRNRYQTLNPDSLNPKLIGLDSVEDLAIANVI